MTPFVKDTPTHVGAAPGNLVTSSDLQNTDNVLPPADREKVKQFLISLGGHWHLSRAGKGFPTRSFKDVDQATEMACAANDRGHCVYYMGNQSKQSLRRRAKQRDIRWCIGSWLDIDDPDPDVARELAERLDWPPTYVAFTGGGWQAFWRYDAPISEQETARAISAWLQTEFEDLSPDRTHSVEHLFRLPGTRNRKDGRNNRLCDIVGGDWANVLPVTEAGRVEPGPHVRPVEVKFANNLEVSINEAWEVLPPWAVRLLSCDRNKSGEFYPSRSEQEWAFIGACLYSKVPVDLIRAFMLLPAERSDTQLVSHRSYWAKIKGRYVPRRNPEAHVARQIGSYLAKEAANEQA